MVNELIDLNSRRAHEARLSKKIGHRGYTILFAIGAFLIVMAITVGALKGVRYGLYLASPASFFLVPALWWKRYLSILPVTSNDLTSRLSIAVLGRLKPWGKLLPKDLWDTLSSDWQSNFIVHHMLITKDVICAELQKGDEAQSAKAMQIATQLADQNGSQVIELGFVISGLLLASPGIIQLIINYKGDPEDVVAVADWLGRKLVEDASRGKQNYGGIGRDWAFGFTPLMNRFGRNVTLGIIENGAHFGWLTESDGVKAMEAAFNNHANSIVLIGQLGIGKSQSVYAFAQRLIEGKTSQSLAYHQIVSINATDVTSNARGPGELEHIMVSLANEAAHAGHIILFLDDAEAFFVDSPGAFDASQILQSIVGSKNTQMIIALTPNGWQRLKASNQSLASSLTPVVLQELPEKDIMRVLEDYATGLEIHNNILIAYEALQEAYRLSGRYEQDEAYPGKAIKLLEQSVPYSIQSFVTSESVQHAVEQTRGVKVDTAAPAEANELLNLEAKIHERMINQTHAVSVVANSLRRARAGVTNPRRPIGSFLFLGPTGVGKTELAKSLAATYFGAESNMIRLDMSEYQQESDVNRLLSDGSSESKSLIMAERQQPFSVVLLDEIEKAHPNILNLLLQLLDEGQLTDTSGRTVSFKDSIIIATSNAGAQSIRDHVARGDTLESFKSELIEEFINSKQFKPELINRFDEIVLFRPLTPAELVQVVTLMIGEINQTLATQKITVSLTLEAIHKIVEVRYDPRLGARPMRRTLQHAVEDTVAQKILRGEANPGDNLQLDVTDLTI